MTALIPPPKTPSRDDDVQFIKRHVIPTVAVKTEPGLVQVKAEPSDPSERASSVTPTTPRKVKGDMGPPPTTQSSSAKRKQRAQSISSQRSRTPATPSPVRRHQSTARSDPGTPARSVTARSEREGSQTSSRASSPTPSSCPSGYNIGGWLANSRPFPNNGPLQVGREARLPSEVGTDSDLASQVPEQEYRAPKRRATGPGINANPAPFQMAETLVRIPQIIEVPLDELADLVKSSVEKIGGNLSDSDDEDEDELEDEEVKKARKEEKRREKEEEDKGRAERLAVTIVDLLFYEKQQERAQQVQTDLKAVEINLTMSDITRVMGILADRVRYLLTSAVADYQVDGLAKEKGKKKASRLEVRKAEVYAQFTSTIIPGFAPKSVDKDIANRIIWSLRRVWEGKDSEHISAQIKQVNCAVKPAEVGICIEAIRDLCKALVAEIWK